MEIILQAGGIDAQGSAVYQPGNTLSMVEGGLSVYAQWAANSAPTPENPDPNPNPNPTPDTTPSTTGVLGEALPPAQPEVGVLGEAAGPEVGVLWRKQGTWNRRYSSNRRLVIPDYRCSSYPGNYRQETEKDEK